MFYILFSFHILFSQLGEDVHIVCISLRLLCVMPILFGYCRARFVCDIINADEGTVAQQYIYNYFNFRHHCEKHDRIARHGNQMDDINGHEVLEDTE